MASFETAYQYTEAIEAGYTVDNGGATYKGIAFKFWMDDPLVKEIYAIVKAANPRKGEIIKNARLDQLIIAFYRKIYWDKIQGDKIINHQLAQFIYDFAVNSGSGIYKMTEVITGKKTASITDDALAIINKQPAKVYSAIWQVRKSMYDLLKTKSKKLAKNYNGWIARLNKFPKTLAA